MLALHHGAVDVSELLFSPGSFRMTGVMSRIKACHGMPKEVNMQN